jgi:hypothetical protein
MTAAVKKQPGQAKQLELGAAKPPRTMAEWRAYAHALERELMLTRMALDKAKKSSTNE